MTSQQDIADFLDVEKAEAFIEAEWVVVTYHDEGSIGALYLTHSQAKSLLQDLKQCVGDT